MNDNVWKCPTCNGYVPIGTQHTCPGPDFSSKFILANHPIYQKIQSQIDKGLKKYNTPVNTEHYSVKGWLNHMQEELVDGLTYANTLEERLKQAEKILDELQTYSHSIAIDDLLEQLKHTLFD